MFNQSALKTPLLTDFLTVFQVALDAATFGKIMAKVISDRPEVDLSAVGDVGTIQDLRFGDLQLKTLGLQTYTVKTIPYGGGLRIPRGLLTRDKTAPQARERITRLAQKQALHVNKLALDNQANLLTDACLDGAAFFYASHPFVGGTQSNLLTGSGVTAFVDRTKPTLAELWDLFNAMKIQIQSMKSDTGEPLNQQIEEFVWLVPYKWEALCKALFDPAVILAPTGAASVPNIARAYKCTVVGNAQLAEISSTQPTYLYAVGAGVPKGLAYAEYLPPEYDSDKDLINWSEIHVTHGEYAVAGLHYQGVVAAKVQNN